MCVDNNKVVSSRLYVHNMITALTSNEMCHNSLFSTRSLWMQIADPPAFSFSGKKVPKNLIRGANTCIAWRYSSLPCTSYNVVVVDKKLFEVFELDFLSFCLEKTDPMRPLVFYVIHRKPPVEKTRQDNASHGRPHSCKASSLGKMLRHAWLRCESKR